MQLLFYFTSKVAKHIATAKSRDVALTPNEIVRLLRGIYEASFGRSYKLALVPANHSDG